MIAASNAQEIGPESRAAISVVAAIIRNFARYSIPLNDTVIAEGYEWFMSNVEGSTGSDVALLDGEMGRTLIAAVTGVEVAE